jgi:hypothetical protein
MQPFRNCLSGAVQLVRSCRGFALKFFKIRAKKVPPSFAVVGKLPAAIPVKPLLSSNHFPVDGTLD